jgi:hypothetical protein
LILFFRPAVLCLFDLLPISPFPICTVIAIHMP